MQICVIAYMGRKLNATKEDNKFPALLNRTIF